MCGVVAVLRLGERPLPRSQVLQSMAASIVHRGPDGWGIFRDEHVMLAAVRLAIVGIEGGRQPHRGCQSDLAAVVNGEIYNHRELRLGLGDHVLDDPCDTAVIPHLYEQHGEAMVEKLRGMFALALWDGREKKLVLARDRLGIKPLFFAQTRDFLVVASEAKAIFASGLVAPAIDRDALDDLFSLGYPCPPRTMFEGVAQLRPGHVAVARPGRGLESRRYWRAPFVARGEHSAGSERALAADLRDVLRLAVKDHLMADVPVAAMVSGGLDSSAIAALAREVTGRSLDTFSLSFEEGEDGAARSPFDESPFADMVNARLDARAHRVPLGTGSAAYLPEMIWALELPLMVPGGIGGVALAEAERAKGFRVALSGDGADELLGGYDVFRASKLRRELAARGLSFLEPAVLGLSARLSGQPRGIARAITPRLPAKALTELWGGILPPWLGSWLLLDVERERLLSPGGRHVRPVLEPPSAFRSLVPDHLGELDGLDADIALELETRLPAWILVISDRSAMARGVEVRVPFLDDRVVERMLALPPSMKMSGFREKQILRAAVQDLLPARIATRKKKPFMTPIAPWFFQTAAPPFVREALSKRALDDAGLFAADVVGRLLTDLERAPPYHVERFRRELVLMLILGTQLLARQFVQGLDRPAPRFELS
ncbi:MAG: asparagine synthase (glutamine-hydrolyzing) [Deltaproteobacteria bacterium]|nr:asparagine synthase (glutamine-hydrolyzing) [Deltaproteobacteria bacterium]